MGQAQQTPWEVAGNSWGTAGQAQQTRGELEGNLWDFMGNSWAPCAGPLVGPFWNAHENGGQLVVNRRAKQEDSWGTHG